MRKVLYSSDALTAFSNLTCAYFDSDVSSVKKNVQSSSPDLPPNSLVVHAVGSPQSFMSLRMAAILLSLD